MVVDYKKTQSNPSPKKDGQLKYLLKMERKRTEARPERSTKLTALKVQVDNIKIIKTI